MNIDSNTGLNALQVGSTILDNNIEQLTPRIQRPCQWRCSSIFKNFWFDMEGGETRPFKCNQWKCLECRERKKWALKFKVDRIAHVHKTRYFWTLTLGDRGWVEGQEEDPYRKISHTWDKLLKRYKKKFKKSLKFIRVVEAHKDGYPHFHFLTHQRINVKWLRENWVECGGGQIMKVVYLEGRAGDSWEVGISKYLSKYFSKNDMFLPKGVRHYETNYSDVPSGSLPEKYNLQGVLMVRWLVVNPALEAVEVVYPATRVDIAEAQRRYEIKNYLFNSHCVKTDIPSEI